MILGLAQPDGGEARITGSRSASWSGSAISLLALYAIVLAAITRTVESRRDVQG
jgi:hypothetical protein